MHCVGELVLDGTTYAVDCFAPRDRSWRQVRTEDQGGVPVPPVGWSPMYFGEDLIFNQISFEAPDTDPAWAGVYDLPDGIPTHHFAWLIAKGETREITRIRRNVIERQPHTFATLRQEIEAEDAEGRVYRFTGEAIATAGDFNSGANGRGQLPQVVDPRGIELNQAWLGWKGGRAGATLGRQRLLFATAKGEALVAKLAGLQTDRITRALRGFSASDAEAVARFLRAMIDRDDPDKVLEQLLDHNHSAAKD